MPAVSLSPPIVPYGADETVFAVIDTSAGGQRQVESADLDTVVSDLIAGRFNDPVRVVAFNTLEHWTQDLSADVAIEIVARCDIEAAPLPEHLEDFVHRHARAREAARGQALVPSARSF